MKKFEKNTVVFVAPQKQRHGPVPVPYSATVVRVGSIYGYIEKAGTERPFYLWNGKSYHKDTNARANGFGFDVYASEQEYLKETHERSESYRLAKRLRHCQINLPAEAVAAIHAVLDEHNVES